MNPCNCGELEMEIFDANDDIQFYLTGSLFQLCLPWCPWETCQMVDFDIRDANKKKLGNLQKTNSGCDKAFLSNADNFSMIFP